jgi:hypothetical protein
MSGRRGILFELLEVALLDLLHERFAAEEVALESGGELPGDDEKLVVNNLGKRNRTARRDQVRAPLKDKAAIP